MFQLFIDEGIIPDSMCFDSKEVIARYEKEGHTLEVRVEGAVSVTYKDEVYRYYSEMPDDLKEMMKDYWKHETNGEIVIHYNNWFEVFYDDGFDSDVVDISLLHTDNLEALMDTWYEEWKEWRKSA